MLGIKRDEVRWCDVVWYDSIGKFLFQGRFSEDAEHARETRCACGVIWYGIVWYGKVWYRMV